MDATDRRMKRLARLAWACAALVLAITTLSAFIRLSRGGPGCEPWPQCAAQSISAEAAPGVTQARITHRVAASAALLLVIVLLVQCHTGTPALPGPGRLAAALLALGVFLAVLGRMAGDSRAAPVVMANLLAGFAMFALACRLALALRPPARAVTPASRAAPRLAMLALLLLGLQVALGAAVGPTACEGSLACGAHRLGGLATTAVLVAAGVLAWRCGGLAARAVVVLALTQAVLGLVVAEAASPLALAVAHNLLAALLGAALLALVPARCG